MRWLMRDNGHRNGLYRGGSSITDPDRTDHSPNLTALSPMSSAVITPRRIVRTMNTLPAVVQLVQLDVASQRRFSDVTSATVLSEDVIDDLVSESMGAKCTSEEVPSATRLSDLTHYKRAVPYYYDTGKNASLCMTRETGENSSFSASSLSAHSFASSVSQEYTEVFDNESLATCSWTYVGEGRQSLVSVSGRVSQPALFTATQPNSSFSRDNLHKESDANIGQTGLCYGGIGGVEGARTRKIVNVRREERIGRGCFGDVFRAVDLDTGLSIAVKEILVAADPSKDMEKQLRALEREIRVMRKLNHKHIINYYSARRDEGRSALLIYMEYVGGGTVAEKLKVNGPFTEEETRKFTCQLLEGLDYLHQQHIVHRDLKGENLFLTEDGVLKVGDFGTSKELQSTLVTDSVAGTPNFMAPEVIACSGHSCMADIWSVGCCVLEMLTGHPPFWNLDNHMAVMFAVMKGKLEEQIPQHISEGAKDFIRLCLRSDPKERPVARQLQQHCWLKGTEEGNAARSCVLSCVSLFSLPSVKESVNRNNGISPHKSKSLIGDHSQGNRKAVLAILPNRTYVDTGKSIRLSRQGNNTLEGSRRLLCPAIPVISGTTKQTKECSISLPQTTSSDLVNSVERKKSRHTHKNHVTGRSVVRRGGGGNIVSTTNNGGSLRSERSDCRRSRRSG